MKISNSIIVFVCVLSMIFSTITWVKFIELSTRSTFNVQRINVIEPDGTIKMVISNKEKFPQEIAMDGWTKEHKRETPGILFYNSEGVESGGIIFSSSVDESGKVVAGNHLSFDKYKQDQTIALTYNEADGKYTSGLSFIDRPEKSLANLERDFSLASKKQQDSMRLNNAWGISRIWLGTADNKPHTRGAYLVMNSDTRNNSLLISVDEEQGTIQFMDKNGRIRLSLGLDIDNQPAIKFYDQDGQLNKRIKG